MSTVHHYVEISHREIIFITYLAPVFLFLIGFVVITRIFCYLTMGWNKSNVCLVGRTALITGGNSGLGYQTALMLAGRGARIIIADKNDCTESIRKIIAETQNNNIVSKFLDLADLQSIRRLAQELNNEEEHLDILINNAGVAGNYVGYTKDGLQLQMQINHLGPFLLTHLLVDLLKRSAPSRIIFVSSLMGFGDQLTTNCLNDDSTTNFGYWDRYVLYSKSKLCNAISSIGFAEKLRGSGVTCNALHPGLVATPIINTALNAKNITFFRQFFNIAVGLFGKTAYEGAQTHVYLAMSDEVKNVTGKFFVDCRMWFQPWKTKDRLFCESIWRKSEELVKLAPHEKL